MELLENLGRKILEKREKDDLGLRAAAKDIGITHSTLSRVERGFHPDLETYQKIYRWLKLPVLTPNEASNTDTPQIHFRRERTVSPELAEALAQMILRAQAAWGLSQPNSE